MSLTTREMIEIEDVLDGESDWSDLSKSAADKLYERFCQDIPHGVVVEQWYAANTDMIEGWICEEAKEDALEEIIKIGRRACDEPE